VFLKNAKLNLMRRIVNVNSIKKNLPKGAKLPKGFAFFVKKVEKSDASKYGFFNVQWSNPQKFGLKKQSLQYIVPFLRLGDGGVVALWLRNPDSIPIVYFDSEGGKIVVSISFEDFLLKVQNHTTKISDIDSALSTIRFLQPEGVLRSVQNTSKLKKEFRTWLRNYSSLQKPTFRKETEEIRKKCIAIAKAMLRDGLSRVFRVANEWWSFDFQVCIKNKRIEITYLDYGKWFILPKKYGLENEIKKLLQYVKNKKMKRFNFTVSSFGTVSVNKDIELVLNRGLK
jgi:hypothetical protein